MIKLILLLLAAITSLVGIFFWKYIEATPWFFVSNLCLWIYLCLDWHETEAILKRLK